MSKVLSHARPVAVQGQPLVKRISAALTLLRQRQKLSKLDDAALRDIGVSRADARREAQRAVWDAPKSWRRYTPRH